NQSQLIQNGAIANFGLGQQGMHFAAGKDYRGFLYAKADGSATLSVSLVAEHNGRRQLLNSTTFQLKSSNTWVRLDFVLTPAASSFCAMAMPNSSFVPRAKLCGYSTAIPEVQSGCYQCTGGISLDVRGAPVRIDSISLQPGSWGRFRGLPVRKDVAEAMFNIAGWELLRLGGSMCNAAGYSWKNFRGTRRDAYRGFWHPVASSSFRIFEVLELCEVAEVQCAITMNSNEDPTDMADFVEYCHGPPNTTWGSMRALDGRKEAYKLFVIEIGNEQPLSMEFVKKVESITAAMRQRAKDLLLPFPLRIAVGQNIDVTPNFDTAEGRSLTTKMLAVLKPFGGAAAWDAHIGGDAFSDVDDFRALLQASSEFFRRAGATKLVAFEENGNTHDLQRALVHARFNILSSYHGAFFQLDAAANGLQVFTQNDNGWDQGQIMMTPDKVWLTPYGWAQAMLSQHAKDFYVPLAVSKSSAAVRVDIGAYQSQNQSIGLRVVNWDTTQANLTVRLRWPWPLPAVHACVLTAPNLADVNPPWEPEKVAPQAFLVATHCSDGFLSVAMELKPWSFVTASV
ncbi:abfA, partial [Symbiodinium necroappetens]